MRQMANASVPQTRLEGEAALANTGMGERVDSHGDGGHSHAETPLAFGQVSELLASGLQEHLRERRYAAHASNQVKEQMLPIMKKQHEALTTLYRTSRSQASELTRLDQNGRSLAAQMSEKMERWEKFALRVSQKLNEMEGYDHNMQDHLKSHAQRHGSMEERMQAVEEKLEQIQRMLTLAGRDRS